MNILRNGLLNCIDDFTDVVVPDHKDAQEFRMLLNIFRAIIKNASPDPLRPTAGSLLQWTPAAASRKRQADPPPFQSPPGYTATKKPRYSEGHDDASDDEAEAQLIFTPPSRPRPASSILDLTKPVYPTPVIASSTPCKLALARLCSNMLVPVRSLRVAVD